MFLKKDNNFIYFLFFIFFSLCLMFCDFNYNLSDKIYFYTDKIIFLYYYIFDNVILFFEKKIVFLKDFKKISNENISLKKNLLLLRSKILYNNLLERENNYFRKILNFPLLKKEDKNFVFVKIIFYHLTNLDEMIVNHMQNFNIKYGSLLFNNIGMLGKVIHSGTNFSRVKLICSKGSSFPVSILRNNLNTIILGYGCNYDMQINDFTLDSDIKIGDIVILPKVSDYSFSGYPVGVIDSVNLDYVYGVLKVDVKYFLELNNLSFGFLYN